MPHKLLLADDSVTIQRVIELTFADEDVHVIAVGDGKQAIERVQQERPDIVLADIGMPERDGYEVASFIKGNPQLAHIPVLLLTGAFEPIDENRARSVGCDGVLVKPFEPQMVINRVRDLLAGRRPAGLWATSPTAQTPVRPPAPAGNDLDVRQRAAGVPAASARSGTDSLEDYFDRLDVAFGSTPETPPAPPAPAPQAPPTPLPVSSALSEHDYGYREPAPPAVAPPAPVNVADWDPHLPGDAAAHSRPAPVPLARSADPVSSWNPDLATRQSAAVPPPQHAALPPPTQSAPVPAAQPAPSAPAVPPMPPLADAFAALLAAEQGQPIVPSAHRTGAVSDDQIDEIVKRVIDRLGNESMRRAVLDTAERLVREEIDRIKGR
jgi:CheY-like chemotaxis protein